MENLVKREGQWIELAKKTYKVRQLRLQYEKEEKELAKRLKMLTKDKPSIGGGYKFAFSVRPGVVQYKQIPELKYVDLDTYRGNPICVWKLEYMGG